MVLSRGNTQDLATMYEAWRGAATQLEGHAEVSRAGGNLGQVSMAQAGGALPLVPRPVVFSRSPLAETR